MDSDDSVRMEETMQNEKCGSLMFSENPGEYIFDSICPTLLFSCVLSH